MTGGMHYTPSHTTFSPREKVGELSSLWDKWADFLFLFIMVTKYNIFPRADNGRLRENKKFWRGDLLTPSASSIGI